MNQVIEKIKNEVAAERGHIDWQNVLIDFRADEMSFDEFEQIENIVAHRLAEHCCKEQRIADDKNAERNRNILYTPLASDKYKP